MEPNENTGSIPKDPETEGVVSDEEPGRQPTTVAGGGLGPLETAVEKAKELED